VHIKLIMVELVNKFLTFYGTWSFIPVLTTACHSTLSWARWIRSTSSHSVSLKPILMLLKGELLFISSKLVIILLPSWYMDGSSTVYRCSNVQKLLCFVEANSSSSHPSNPCLTLFWDTFLTSLHIVRTYLHIFFQMCILYFQTKTS
jgi:hypothetical protein